ncbi:14-3-3-like protein E [Teleopsis dalmanni]|uniref:14-3-3-like protein E n=1 Tax=Teleopsis dalmanni TaxID=139649 RepID=UPI0018CF2038|nr:14-3-3-like protein E [Teleopsis dalmanni]
MMSRAYYNYRALLAQHAHRYPDMLLSLNNIIDTGAVLTIQERNMILIAYKNIVSENRAALKMFTNPLPDEESLDAEAKYRLADRYRHQIENFITVDCNRVIFLIDTERFPCQTHEQMIFNYKTLADYHHYLCELDSNRYLAICIQRCQLAYESAFHAAMQHLSPTNILRMRIALNFSIFNYNILRATGHAIQLAATELSRAELQMQRYPNDDYAGALYILEELNNCVTLWNTNDQPNGDICVLYVKDNFKMNGDTDSDNATATNSLSSTTSKVQSEPEPESDSDDKSETHSSMSACSEIDPAQQRAAEELQQILNVVNPNGRNENDEVDDNKDVVEDEIEDDEDYGDENGDDDGEEDDAEDGDEDEDEDDDDDDDDDGDNDEDGDEDEVEEEEEVEDEDKDKENNDVKDENEGNDKTEAKPEGESEEKLEDKPEEKPEDKPEDEVEAKIEEEGEDEKKVNNITNHLDEVDETDDSVTESQKYTLVNGEKDETI